MFSSRRWFRKNGESSPCFQSSGFLREEFYFTQQSDQVLWYARESQREQLALTLVGGRGRFRKGLEERLICGVGFSQVSRILEGSQRAFQAEETPSGKRHHSFENVVGLGIETL